MEGWNYQWSSNYGSPKLDLVTGEEGTTSFSVVSATLSEDGKEVQLFIPDMKPAMQMHLDWSLSFSDMKKTESFIHFTVHALNSIKDD